MLPEDYEPCNICPMSTSSATLRRRLSTPTLSKFKKRRWSLLAILTLLILMSTAVRYVIYTTDLINQELSQMYGGKTYPKTVACYSEVENDALPSADYLDPPENSIFFHETSCSGGLDSRQACCVESAARLHPERTVYVLFNSPVTEYALKNTCLAKLTELPNIQLVRLHIEKYGNNTPLASVLISSLYNERPWMIEHTADLLRFITLYKYSGVYLDLDTLVIKNLDALGSNWVAREDDTTVSAAAIALSSEGIGRDISEIVVNDLEWNFRPMRWSHNGPGAVNRAVLFVCTVGTEILPTEDGDFSCQGFTVYNPLYFYPIHYESSRTYFTPGEPIPESPLTFGHHFWNRLTKNMTVTPGSPYDELAKQYCPSIRGMYEDTFGS